jgi:lysyl-tRNA synthetase class 1
MSAELKKAAFESSAWPFVEARRILDDIGHKTPAKGYVLFETGYGPSGLPHIGTFGEVARTTMVLNAFKTISDIPTRLFCFSDDIDGLRKVPSNLPNQDLIRKHLHEPLTSVPDPFGEKESFGHYMNAKLCSFLDTFGFSYEFQSATEYYHSGKFDEYLIKVLEHYDEIMNIMLPTLGEERQATYSPFLPICKKTNHVLQVKVEEIDAKKATIKYIDPETGEMVETLVTGGSCKLQWKPDFGMRWAALDVNYEIYGKDHLPNGPIYTKIAKALGSNGPTQFFYELFLDQDGKKISKSSGNGIGVEEWLKYAPVESMSLFMYQNPIRAKRLYFDVIPKNVDEYLTFVEKYHTEEDMAKRLANPAYHIHNGSVPKIDMHGLSFALLLNLASVCNPDSKDILWAFISRYAPGANAENSPYLDKLAMHAVRYYNDFVKSTKQYKKPDEREVVTLQKISELLSTIPSSSSPEEIQKNIYDIGMEAGYENLRDYFQMLYEVLLGQSQGPRFGSFVALYGIENSKKLIDIVLSN